jgi:hypothetical protein
MATTAVSADDPATTLGILGHLAAGVLTAMGIRLRLGDERSSRGGRGPPRRSVSSLAPRSPVGRHHRRVAADGSRGPAVVARGGRLSAAPSSALTQVGVLASLTALPQRSWSGCRRLSSPKFQRGDGRGDAVRSRPDHPRHRLRSLVAGDRRRDGSARSRGGAERRQPIRSDGSQPRGHHPVLGGAARGHRAVDLHQPLGADGQRRVRPRSEPSSRTSRCSSCRPCSWSARSDARRRRSSTRPPSA